jgi:glycosyltransferase involved in cell wall biosynthesis
MFWESAKYMSELYHKDIIYLNQHVVNSNYYKSLNENFIIYSKNSSTSLVFIGGSRYKENAIKVINAFRLLKLENKFLTLNIIGMDNSTLKDSLSEDISCYGWLDKGDQIQNDIYYDIIINSKCLVNPSNIISGYSSIIESMYFYTPVVVNKMHEFVHEFGDDIPFGEYITDDSDLGIYESIKKIIYSPAYNEKCHKAHQAVEKYSWDNYMDKILDTISGKIPMP